jgi:hypothetical protein
MRGTRDFNSNSVFFRRSTDGGTTWQTPVLVSRSGRTEAHNVKIAVTSAGRIHLVWLKNKSGGPRPEVVWANHSDDRGHSWSTPQELAVPDALPYQLAVAADSAGGVHAVFIFMSHDGRDARLYYARWEGKQWTAPCALDPDYDAIDPTIAADGKGRLYVVWDRLQPSGAGARRSVAVYATLTIQ